MKILGHAKLKQRERTVLVGHTDSGEPVRLRVRAPKLNIYEWISEEIGEPEPPLNGEVKRTKRGKIVIGSDGQAVRAPNDQDPKYLKEVARCEKARSIALVLSCLGDQVEPEVKKGSMDPVDYYHAVYDEMQDAGIDIAAFHSLTAAATELSQPLTEEEVGDAKAALGVDDESQQGLEEGK